MEVDWVSGACMVIRRKAAEEVGLLDERFFMYWEDADYCKSMWECGWKVVYDPRPTVYHYAGASSSQAVFRSVCEFHKSVYRWYDKHGPWTTVALRPLLLAGLILRGAAVLTGRLYPRFKKNPGDDREGFLWNRSPEKRGETVFLSQIVIF
jgi:hypothetical protein